MALMNIWFGSTIAFVLITMPCLILLIRLPLIDALVVLQFGTGACVLALTVLAIALNRPSFLDIALTLAMLSYPASLLFAHFFERWL
jgi:multisubunit Na+/H+ antiporter MnhF subunit